MHDVWLFARAIVKAGMMNGIMPACLVAALWDRFRVHQVRRGKVLMMPNPSRRKRKNAA